MTSLADFPAFLCDLLKASLTGFNIPLNRGLMDLMIKFTLEPLSDKIKQEI